MTSSSRPGGITALGIFFAFGATMAFLAAMMLLFPGTILDPLWKLNPHARAGFAVMGVWAVLLMTVVSTACATTAFGLLRCTRWGYLMALIVLSVNLLGDTANAVIARDWRTLIGVPIGGAMIIYLLKNKRIFLG
jgi:hypothetical protein